ncbi:hypothetical protein [Grimontia kaedaensis]
MRNPVRLRTTLIEIAEELCVTMVQVLYGFVIRHPSKPLPIVG